MKIHKYFSCEICFAGFVSDNILIEHKLHDHPEGPPQQQQPQATPEEPTPSVSDVTGPPAEPAPKIIRSLDLDPFEEKLDTRIGLVNPDRNHQVKCEECGRFLKSRKLRKIHVQCYHVTTAYQCPFHPNFIFYTMDALVRHCKKKHELCNQCNTMANNRTALELHFRKHHPKSPVPKAQPVATSSPIPGDEPEIEQVEPSEDKQAKQQPQPQQAQQPTLASMENIHPVWDPISNQYVCSMCRNVCGTQASFRLHLNVHRKVSCIFCYRKFLNASAMEQHIKEAHTDSKVPQFHCKLEGCKEWFRTQVESFRHLRSTHKTKFVYRCKHCADCFLTVKELFRHKKVHNPHQLDYDAKWRCSICGETFDNLDQLMNHTRIHPENSYACDECTWKFSIVSELSIHGHDIHDTRKHSCYWCTRYFRMPELLLQHRNDNHNFECSRCNDAFPSALQLTAHQMVKHGKPITEEDEKYEQMREAKELRDKKRAQRHAREAATKTIPTFSCKLCISHFKKQKDLDDHTCKYHTFVCKICQHVTKTLAELDYHMDIKHDSTPEKLPAQHPEDEQMVRAWKHEQMVEDQRQALQKWRDIKDMKAREEWADYWAAWTAQKSLDAEKKSQKRK